MSVQSAINQIIGSAQSGASAIQAGIEKGERTQNLKKQIGLQKQQIWSQKGQIARMKKANERIKERQEVIAQQRKNIKEKLDLSIGGISVSPEHPIYKQLIGGDNVTK